MNKIVTPFFRLPALYFFAFAASILLSAWVGYHESVINPDGICYVLSAERVGSETLANLAHFCVQAKWPFYSLLIYGLARVSDLSYVASAYVLNSFFSLLSVISFILIVKELGGTKRVLWLAAFTILLSHNFNGVREYIIRDHGFWAFYLVSLFLLLRYFREPHFFTAVVFSLSLLAATLFRIEGAVFLLALPFVSWLHFSYSLKQRAYYFFSLHFVSLLLLVSITLWFLSHQQATLPKLGRVFEITNQLQHGVSLLIERYHSAKEGLLQHVLGTEDAARDAGTVLLLVWLTWYVINVWQTLSFSYGVLVIYAWWLRTAKFSLQNALILYSYLLVNVVITFIFLMERSFLSKRYLIALAVTLMLWVPFALNDLYEKAANWRYRILLGCALLAIFISSLGGIIDFGYSKSYIRKAGNWIATYVPKKATLYANDVQLMYYSQHFGNQIFNLSYQWQRNQPHLNEKSKEYDYLALRLSHDSDLTAMAPGIKLKPLQVFRNKRNDRVIIYKVL